MADALFLQSSETVDLVGIDEYVAAVRDAYRQIGDGAPAKPRTALPNKDPAGFLTSYIAILPDTGVMGGYTYSAGFAGQDAWFMTPIFDADTGQPLALLDGAYMNPFKTGAVGAVGIDALAREDASTLGVIGSGKQARGQLLAANAVRDFTSVHVYSPTKAHRERFADAMDRELDASVGAVGSSRAAIENAEVVITATNASEPVFDREDLQPGTHITAMGQYNPQKRELDAATIADAKYVPDLRDRVFQDAGSFLHALDTGRIDEEHIYAELGDIIAGNVPGRESSGELTVFDSGGTAIETAAAGYLLYQEAAQSGLGSTIEFEAASDAMPTPWES